MGGLIKVCSKVRNFYLQMPINGLISLTVDRDSISLQIPIIRLISMIVDKDYIGSLNEKTSTLNLFVKVPVEICLNRVGLNQLATDDFLG